MIDDRRKVVWRGRREGGVIDSDQKNDMTRNKILNDTSSERQRCEEEKTGSGSAHLKGPTTLCLSWSWSWWCRKKKLLHKLIRKEPEACLSDIIASVLND